MESIGTISIIRITFPEKHWFRPVKPLVSRTFQFEIKSFIPISQYPIIGNNLVNYHGNESITDTGESSESSVFGFLFCLEEKFYSKMTLSKHANKRSVFTQSHYQELYFD